MIVLVCSEIFASKMKFPIKTCMFKTDFFGQKQLKIGDSMNNLFGKQFISQKKVAILSDSDSKAMDFQFNFLFLIVFFSLFSFFTQLVVHQVVTNSMATVIHPMNACKYTILFSFTLATVFFFFFFLL